MDHGAPISYKVLTRGTPVYSSDGEELGRVTRVLAVDEANMFDGIVIAVTRGGRLSIRGGQRFVDAPEVARIYERAVELTITAEQAEQLPER